MKPNKLLTKEYLIKNYINLGKTVIEIQEELGIKSHNSVVQALRKHRIPARSPQSVSERGLERRSKKNRRGYEGISGSTWCILKANALVRHLEFDITIEYIWELFIKQNGRCAISGKEIFLAKKNTPAGRFEQTASLDRIDSKQGYIEGNVQWIHKRIQTMKMHHNQEEFIEWCKIIANHNKKDCE